MANERLSQSLMRAVQVRPRGSATRFAGRTRSWQETADRIARSAAGLCQFGLEPGQRVAILALNSDRYLEAYFAIPWAGGVVVPLNTRLAPADLQFMLADCGAPVLCLDREFAHLLPAFQAACPALQHIVQLHGDEEPGIDAALLSWDALVEAHAPMADAGRHGDDLAAICYTGGSTGRPKGVMLSHANLVANAVNACHMIGYDASSVFLHASPMFHLTDGMSTIAITMAGGTHVFVPKFDAAAVLQSIAEHAITNITLVPTMIAMLLEVDGIERMKLDSLRQLMFGAAPISEATLRRAVAIWPEMLFLHGWGMTELAPLGSMLPRSMRSPAVAGKRLASCGQTMPNLELKIVDEHGTEVPRGSTGEIVVRGPTVMQGYWNMPVETEAAFRGGWFHTGDAALMDDEGYLYIVDRLKDMIISGGENIYSIEVENAISMMPGVAEVAVIGVPDDRWGEAVHAVVVPAHAADLTAEAVIGWARERLATYKAPRSVTMRPERLPVSGAGKVLKSELRAPYWAEQSRRI